MSTQNDMGIHRKAEDRIDGQIAVPKVGLQTEKDTPLAWPSVEQILSQSTASPPSLAPAGTEKLSTEEQKELFGSVQALLKKFEEGDEDASSFDLREFHASLEQTEANAWDAGHKYKALQGVLCLLGKLWNCKSDYLVQAAEALANGSRNPSWRLPYGQAGILEFFLQLLASSEDLDDNLLLHSLRLAGNSCADTDENRLIVVKDNYILGVMGRILNPNLVHVVIPVVYNICVDFEPAQSQVAANRIAYILLKMIHDSTLKDNDAILGFAYELIELATDQEQGIEQSPDETISLLMAIAVDEDIDFTQFTSVASCLMTYLDNQRFQTMCVSHRLVEKVLSVLRRSLSIKKDKSSGEDVQAFGQLQLKMNQTLAEISAVPQFMEVYPLDSALAQTLKSWMATNEDQLQICSCVMLGNLARSDEVCQIMVRDLGIHKELIPILNSDARGAVLHSTLGFLKNLAIAGDNRLYLGEAGIIPAISRLWGYESIPQVQFSAASIARQLIISSVDNISRLLECPPPPPDQESSADGTDTPTYLSLLLSLFKKTDSIPVKTEIGRIVASICRTIVPKSREDSPEATMLERFFNVHEGIARPVGAMIIQTQWPVIRSEGWFALALMASTKPGSLAVVDCLESMDVYPLLDETLSAEVPDSADETEKLKMGKDRDNTTILVQELFKNEPDTLPSTWKAKMEDLMKTHLPRHLKGTKSVE